MRFSKKEIIIGLVALVLAGCTGSPPTQDAGSSSSQMTLPQDSSSSSLVSTIGWKDFTNERLGFSMKLPPRVGIGINGDMSAVVAIEDPTNTVVYITTKEYVDDKNRVQSTTLKVLQANDIYTPDRWLIESHAIASEDQLTAFVSKTFGTGCEISTRDTTATGYQQLRIRRAEGASEESCPIGGGFNPVILYSPEKQRLLYWQMGGGVMFADEKVQMYYEDDMIKSVRFL